MTSRIAVPGIAVKVLVPAKRTNTGLLPYPQIFSITKTLTATSFERTLWRVGTARPLYSGLDLSTLSQMLDSDKTSDTKEHSGSNSTAPTSVTSEKDSSSRSRESTSNYASSSSGPSRGRPRDRPDIANPLSAANLAKR